LGASQGLGGAWERRNKWRGSERAASESGAYQLAGVVVHHAADLGVIESGQAVRVRGGGFSPLGLRPVAAHQNMVYIDPDHQAHDVLCREGRGPDALLELV